MNNNRQQGQIRQKYQHEQRKARFNPIEQKEARERIESLLEEIRQLAGHELINKMYLANKELREYIISVNFPIGLLYRFSLRHELQNNPKFIQLSTSDLAKHEKISPRSAFRMRKQLFSKKSLF